MILAWLAALFVAGIVLGPAGPTWLTVLGACLALAAFPWLRGGRLGPVSLAVAAICLGCARSGTNLAASGPNDISFYNGRSVTVLGRVSAEPDIRDTGANYLIQADEVSVGSRNHPVGGKIQLHLPLSQPLGYGDMVELTGHLRAPSNRTSFDYRGFLARRGIRSSMAFVRVRDQGPGNTGRLGWIVQVRAAIEGAIDRSLPEPEASLLIAITLGARSATLGDLAPALVATGLIHIVAISGIKVAMVAGTTYELARLTRRRFLTLILAMLSLAFYVLLTGSTVSGIRSAVMWGLVFLAAYLGRTTVALVSLATAAALMTALQPDLVSDIGFQLSTIGTFAIVSFTPPLMRLFRPVPSPIRESLCVTIAAQIGTLPVVAIGFGQISLAGPLANALVLPLLPVLIGCGFVIGGIGAIAWIGPAVAGGTLSLLRFVIEVSGTLAHLPVIHVSSPLDAGAVGTYYIALALLSAWLLRASNWAPAGHWASRGRELGLAACAGLTLLTASVVTARGQEPSRLVWLGSGESFLLTTPHRAILIDGSPHPLALLRRLGAFLPEGQRTLDMVIVTDSSGSNVLGLRSVLRRYVVTQVLDVGSQYPSSTYASWRDDLRTGHVPALALRTGVEVRFDNADIRAVAPDSSCALPRNCVAMLRVFAGRHTFLLAGSAAGQEQREALFRSVSLRADTVISTGTSAMDPRFIRATGRHVQVVSMPGVGTRHRPLAEHSPVVVARW